MGDSFSEVQNTLAGQAQKAIFKSNKYLYKFPLISPKHKLDLFDKLVSLFLIMDVKSGGLLKLIL